MTPESIATRVYGPSPLLIPDKLALRRCLKALKIRARNEYDENKRFKYRIIRDEIKKLYNELY